jgi:hypothetical protein
LARDAFALVAFARVAFVRVALIRVAFVRVVAFAEAVLRAAFARGFVLLEEALLTGGI